eukprot:GHVS01090866.1.p1 GENE.GHVS01090866.1~~GHVS01090866.1.p1  ORF type:complete len:637 (+),score=159.04 GHVS01090866.1:39-1913(+)
MQASDCDRLEHLLAVQDDQMQSLRQMLKQREDELDAVRGHNAALQQSESELQHALQASRRDAEGFRGKESDMQMELHEKLNRQGASLLGLANKHLEGREREVELLSFEVEKKERVIASLRDEIRKREECLFDLRNDHEDLLRWKEKVQEGKVAAVLQHQADAEAKVALTTAELQAQAAEKQTLQNKFTQLEERLREKDVEIRGFREQLYEQEEDCGRMHREMKSLQFEVNLKDVQLAELHKTAQNREGELSVQLRRSKEQHEQSLRVQNEQRERQLEDREVEIDRLRKCLEEMGAKVEDVENMVRTAEDEGDRKDERICELQRELADAVARMEASDLSAEVDLLRRGEKHLKRRLSDQVDVIEALQQDSVILQKTRLESALKDKQCLELKAQMNRLTSRIAVETAANSHLMGSRGSPEQQLALLSSRPPSSRCTAPLGGSHQPTSPATSSWRELRKGWGGGRMAEWDAVGMKREVEGNNSGGRCYTQPLANNPGGWGYEPVMSDPVDVTMSNFLNRSSSDVLPMSVRRIRSGVYSLGQKEVHVKLINGRLMVEVVGGVMAIADYVASERYSMNLPVPPKLYQYNSSTNTGDPVGVRPPGVGGARPVDPFSAASAVAVAPQGRMS